MRQWLKRVNQRHGITSQPQKDITGVNLRSPTTHCRWPISRQVHKMFVLLYFNLQQGLAISISIFTAKTAKLGKYPDQQMKHEQLFIRLNTQNTPSYLKEKLFNIEWCLFTRLWLPVEIVKNPRSEPKERLTSTDFVCGT